MLRPLEIGTFAPKKFGSAKLLIFSYRAQYFGNLNLASGVVDGHIEVIMFVCFCIADCENTLLTLTDDDER